MIHPGRTRRHRRALAASFGWRACAALAALLLGGCGLNRELARRADTFVAQERPAELTCAAPDHCAIDSPYRQLMDAADAASTPAAPVHYVNVLEHGEDALLLRVHLIRAARKSIDIQTFTWAGDDAGWLVLDELVAAARRGVKVRVLSDQLFSLGDVEWLARLARAHADFEFRMYGPTFDQATTPPLEFAAGLVCCFRKFNQRMHNKLFLIDGEIGIAGGRNYENHYFDWDEEFNYRDRDVLVLGPVAGAQMQASFNRFWTNPRTAPLTRLNDVNGRLVADAREDTRDTWPPMPYTNPSRIAALRARAVDAEYIRAHFTADALRVSHVDYFSDAPGKAERPDDPARAALSTRIAQLLEHARAQVVFETPYLVLSRRAHRIFRALHKRKPRVTVIVSTNSLAATDAFAVYALSYKYKKRYLDRYGFEIHEFKPFPEDTAEFLRNRADLAGGKNADKYQRYGRAPLKRGGMRLGLHGKSLVIDGHISVIGSHNFDPRSDGYNTESGFIIDDAEVAERVRAAILMDAAPRNAWTIARVRRPRLLAGINDAIANVSMALPLFDLWPFRYASSFELNPGCTPLPPSDPGFYACYTDVGSFPEVNLPLKTIYTRIVTAFGAGLVNIL